MALKKIWQDNASVNNRAIPALVMMFLLLVSGCQQEFDEVTQTPPEEVIQPNSVIAELIQHVALKDGSADNILDRSSCTSLELPLAVHVNGQALQINSDDDYKLVERILDESEADEDTLALNFPVTVVLADYTTLIANTENELENIIEQCAAGSEDDDIECIDFDYPLTFYVYDSNNQVSDVSTINNDRELFHFFRSLDNGHLLSLAFPVALFLSGGQELSVNDNARLEEAIEGAMDDCDEDDDNDHNDDDVDDTSLITVLTDGTWAVTHFFDDTDRTEAFEGIAFSFHDDGTGIATNGLTEISGTWKTYGDEGFLEIELDFGEEEPFEAIQEDWELVQFTGTLIELKDDGENIGPSTTLIFEKI